MKLEKSLLRILLKSIYYAVGITAFIFVCLCIFAHFYSPPFVRNKSMWTGCLQSLQGMSKGVQSYLTENRDFSGVHGNTADEFCNHIIPGYDTQKECMGRGLVRKRILESCDAFNVKVDFPAQFQYEITGISKDKTKCAICVTEKGYCPKSYKMEYKGDSSCENYIGNKCKCPH